MEERHYKIGELARMFGVTVRTIRYYEELKLIESMPRDGSVHRRYSARCAVHLRRIQQLKDYGLSLSDICELFDLARRDRSGKSVRDGLLSVYREKLSDANRRKASLDAYIDDLSWHVDQLEAVKDFFQCPGSACLTCPFPERCDIRMLASEEEDRP
jgi:DNA-binding transcriptional MerR regulator